MSHPTSNLAGLDHCWLSPEGEIIEVGYHEHDYYASEVIQMGYAEMERLGWVKLSEGCWEWITDGVTQAQLDVIYEWHEANGVAFNHLDYSMR